MKNLKKEKITFQICAEAATWVMDHSSGGWVRDRNYTDDGQLDETIEDARASLARAKEAAKEEGWSDRDINEISIQKITKIFDEDEKDWIEEGTGCRENVS